MSFVAAATIGAAGIGAATSMSLAAKQRKEAEKIRNSAVDPGIQRNYGLQRTSEILADNYSNYNLPGLTRYQEQITSGGATAMDRIRQGATSSEDLLAGASRVQGVENDALGGLYTQQAQGKLSALDSYLQSMNRVGDDQVRVNNVQLDRYDAVLREAAALGGASTRNLNNGIQDILTSIGPMIQNFAPQSSIDPSTGQLVKGKSHYQNYFNK